jgi:hypothetical protein
VNPSPLTRDTADNNILVEAQQITSADRQRFYGHPLDNHGCTAGFWDYYIERRRQACELAGEQFVIDERDVCMMNTLQKISRDANLRKRDNLVDMAGYARNAEMVEQEQDRRDLCYQDAVEETLAVLTEKDVRVVGIDHGLRGADGKFHRLSVYAEPICDEHDHGRPDGFTDGF